MKRFFLLLIMIFSLSVCVSANDNAYTAIKSLKLNNYNSSEINDNGLGYDITVSFDDWVCYVTADYDGVVLTYNKVKNAERNSLPILAKTDAKRYAHPFVVNVASDILGTIDLSKAEISYNGNYQVVYYRTHNGIVYKNNYVSVGVDSDTGEIVSYHREYSKDLKFAEFQSTVDNDYVFNLFKRNKGLKLTYNKIIKGKAVSVYPVYTLDQSLFYNAVNGFEMKSNREIIPDNYFDITSMYEKINDGNKESADILTPNEAQSLAYSIPELQITDDYRIVSAKYLKNSNHKYLIILNYVSDNAEVSVTVDAENGIVCEFTRNGESGSGDGLGSDDVVKNYITKYLGEYIYNLKLSSVYKGEKSVYLYERTVDGISFPANGLCIAVDKNGNISNISFLWENVDFPNLDNIISEKTAYDIFEEKCKFELKYYFNGEYNVPIYALDSNTTGIIDANSGEILGYDGKILHSAKYLNYTDLDGFYGREKVEKMADCDVYASRGNVALNEPILQKDYLLLISSYLPTGKPVIENFGDLNDQQLEMLYNAFTSTGVLSADEIDINAPVSREKAVEYFIKTIGYGDVAKNYFIFNSRFKDVRGMEKDLIGYIELAYSLNIVSGSNGNFYPKQYLKNGDALIMVYNYLANVGD